MQTRLFFVVTACAFAAVVGVVACASFSTDETTESEAGRDDAADAAASRWCASRDAGFLCDDFDDPAPNGWMPWDRLDAFGDGGTAVRDTTKTKSAPNAFLASVSGVSRQLLQKSAVLTGKHLVWSFDMDIEKLVGREVIVAEASLGQPGALIFQFSSDAQGTLRGQMGYERDPVVQFILPPLTPHVGEWVHLQIELLASGGVEPEWRVKIGNAEPAAYKPSVAGTNLALGLGARLMDSDGRAVVRFDNVEMVVE